MADEQKTLLKIEGDASGAKKAAQETRAAAEQMGKAAAQASESTAEAGRKAGDATDDQAKKTERAKSEFEKLAESMGISVKEANEFKQVLGRVSPELARVLDIAMKGQGAFKALFTGLGAAAVAATAAIQGIAFAMREAEAAAARTRAEMERVKNLNDEIRRREQSRTEQVAETMAKAGIVGEAAVSKGAAIERKLIARGHAPEAARAVIPFAVDEAGQQLLDDEAMANLAAMEEFSPGALSFDDPRKLDRARRKAVGELGKKQDLISKWRRAIESRQQRQREGVAQMDTDAIVKALTEGQEAVPQDQVQAAVEDIKALVTRGRVGSDGLSMFWSGSDRLIWEARQQAAARRATALGLLDPESAGRAAGIGGERASNEEIMGEVRGVGEAMMAPVRKLPAARRFEEVAKGATYVFNHGLQVFGRDNRDVQNPRVSNP